jgi:hypothetical protein
MRLPVSLSLPVDCVIHNWNKSANHSLYHKKSVEYIKQPASKKAHIRPAGRGSIKQRGRGKGGVHVMIMIVMVDYKAIFKASFYH